MKLLTVFAIGLLFGLGLVLSGMSNPAVVLAFLDVAGDWNPALAFVMGGALLVAAPAYAFARRSGRTLTSAPLALPAQHDITPALVIGSALFGMGWGLSGFCPGPVIVAAATGKPVVLVFVASMAAGVGLQRWLSSRKTLGDASGAAGKTGDGELACG